MDASDGSNGSNHRFHRAIGPAQLPLLTVMVATIAAKYISAHAMGAASGPALWFSLWPLDIAVYTGLCAVSAALESRWRPAIWGTVLAAWALFALGASNALYLVVGGEQGTWGAVRDLMTRFAEAWDVVSERIGVVDVATSIGMIVGLGWPWWRLFRRAREVSTQRSCTENLSRVRLWAAFAIVATGIAWTAPRLSTVGGQNLARNAMLTILRTSLERMHPGRFEGWSPAPVVAARELRAFAERPDRPNVLMVILESTRFDHTSLAGPTALAHTPTLAALADEGFVSETTRAVLPHTTKSMFSALCGQWPTMQRRTIEISAQYPVRCLPSILRDAGYATAFFQSSWGTFESRPRLVDKFGYDHFEAWEDIQGQRLGYLASDDGALVPAFRRWIGKAGERSAAGRPFFATILTSAAHHPYRLPRDVRARVREHNLPATTAAERYARLVEAEDTMLAGLLEVLRETGTQENTLVVVFGDHGEGFGAYGVKQHDHNFYEEGLRVPWVMRGPGVPKRRIRHNTTLIDMVPTVLGRLGLPVLTDAPLVGHDVFGDYPKNAPKWFGCYSSSRCQGFVIGHEKLVRSIAAGDAWYFDLAADPYEMAPRLVPDRLAALNAQLTELMRNSRSRGHPVELAGLTRFGAWRCEPEEYACKHPRARKEKARYELDAETLEQLSPTLDLSSVAVPKPVPSPRPSSGSSPGPMRR